ncbi:RING-H2 finger protein ATL66-like [Arachis hypogaea]|uniref:RING-type E3 ubiquitin transferase n=1 Tax=Arachis hypogaea TaxID=3818 RepID=A0A445BVL7_ARAHY|nr:RING-H2 finger protein ATL47-like [Arachis hypogaea]RYR42765.1 hypothetical protein Ahy_A08g039207 [Arachis hypogaea]
MEGKDREVLCLFIGCCTLFLVVNFSDILLCVFLKAYRFLIRCPSSSEVNPSSSPNDLQHHQVVIESFPDISSLQSDGLDSSVISSLPVSEFENVGDHKSINADCVICLGEFEKGEKLKLLPQCAHAFHVSCIDAWFQSHSNCPLCRSQVHHVEDAIAGYSVSSYPLLETLRREDFSRDSDELIRSVRSECCEPLAMVSEPTP